MPEREGLQPRYRRLAYAVGPREIGLRSAFRESLDSLLPLVAGQSRRAPKTHATGLGTDTAVAGTSKDQCPLELRKTAQNSQHQATMRRLIRNSLIPEDTRASDHTLISASASGAP